MPRAPSATYSGTLAARVAYGSWLGNAGPGAEGRPDTADVPQLTRIPADHLRHYASRPPMARAQGPSCSQGRSKTADLAIFVERQLQQSARLDVHYILDAGAELRELFQAADRAPPAIDHMKDE